MRPAAGQLKVKCHLTATRASATLAATKPDGNFPHCGSLVKLLGAKGCSFRIITHRSGYSLTARHQRNRAVRPQFLLRVLGLCLLSARAEASPTFANAV